MKDIEIKTGDVFLAYNKYMYPPKEKFHLCIDKDMYFLINTRPSVFNCEIMPEDCSFLKYKSYINVTTIRTEPIRDLHIIKKEELTQDCLKRLIKKIKVVPTYTNSQREKILSLLESCVKV